MWWLQGRGFGPLGRLYEGGENGGGSASNAGGAASGGDASQAGANPEGDAQAADANEGGESANDAPQAGDSKEETELKRVRREAQDLRKRLRTLETEKQKTEREKLSETERLQADAKRATELEEKLAKLQNERTIERSVRVSARDLKVDADLAIELIRPDKVKFDDEGNPTNLEEIIKDLKKRFPQIATTQPSSAAGTPPPTPNNNPANPQNDKKLALTEDAIRQMTPAQINANWDAVKAFYDAKKAAGR